MIADALGWTLDRITDDVQPKLATVTISSEFLAVDPGYVCGIIQDGIGYRKGQPVIRLHFEAYLGAPESYDTVDIEGAPRLSMKLQGGIPGDIATASIVVNSIPRVLAAAPGLHTMRDMPLPSFFPGRESVVRNRVMSSTIDPITSITRTHSDAAILARCPKCDAGLPVRAAEAPDAIKCGRCGQDIPLSISPALREDRAVDSVRGLRRPGFLYSERLRPEDRPRGRHRRGRDQRDLLLVRARLHRVQHPRRRGAHRSRRLRTAQGSHRLLPVPLRVPRLISTHRGRLRPAHR